MTNTAQKLYRFYARIVARMSASYQEKFGDSKEEEVSEEVAQKKFEMQQEIYVYKKEMFRLFLRGGMALESDDDGEKEDF